MEYIVCKFKFNKTEDFYFDILSSMLGEIGFDSFETETDYLAAYIMKSNYDPQRIKRVIQSYPLTGVRIDYTSEIIDSKDWNSAWESTFEPIIIDDQIHIHSSIYPKRIDMPYDITINPRMSFGSGSHYTTRLILQMLLHSDIFGKSVLDLGCGTGILGIFAKLRGCIHLTACDIEHSCIENTKENFMLNGLESAKIHEGSIDSLETEEKFDIILSNIHLNIHISLMDEYSKKLNDGGSLYLSGFYVDDIKRLTESANHHGLVLAEMSSEENWATLKYSSASIYRVVL